MNPIGNESSIREASRQLRNCAQELERNYRSMVREFDRPTWISRQSSMIRERIKLRRSTVASVIQELQRVANELDSHASWVHQTIHELEELENSIRRWASANPPGSSVSGVDASLIEHWPSHYSFEWRELHNRLRSSGEWV